MSDIIENLAQISDAYDVVFCDLWGCLHNGFAPFAAAVTALEAFNAKGGVTLLLTNSPRPRPSVMRQLDKIGVARTLYVDVAASGDAAQYALASGAVGHKVYHLGPARDLGFFEGLDSAQLGGKTITRVPLEEAEGIVCTGLFDDDTESPEDYRAMLLAAKNRGLKLLCANPDILVDKGDKRIFCAGALAKAYEDIGGESLYFGKPHPAIYDLARQRLSTLGKSTHEHRILCIGDGINTDIRGGIGEDLDTLFISGGLAAAETGTLDQPDPVKLSAFLKDHQLSPRYTMGHLR